MRRITSTRLAVTASALAAAAMMLVPLGGADAQRGPPPPSKPLAPVTAKEWKTPADLNQLQKVDTRYTPPRTAYDERGGMAIDAPRSLNEPIGWSDPSLR